ncbi:MAG: DUF2723 domain-containing protein [Proteobacteria bacterium]|nr:DUF2723 domain-containing protein [Pseudomonadota bacterium]
MGLKKVEIVFFLFISLLLIFFVYPLEPFSDGTDFLMGGFFLGLPHPPSYPAFTQIVHLTKYLPFSNLAFRVNLFTGITAFLFLLIFYKNLKGEFLEKFASIFIILFSTTFFENSINGELYILNLLLIFLMIFFSDKQDIRFLYLNSFLFGVAFGVHQTVIFAGIYIFIKYLLEKREITIVNILTCFFFFILGLSVYLYLPLRAIKEPLWNWGNPKSLMLFLNSIFRHDFQTSGIIRDWNTLFQQLITFNPLYEFGVINGLIILMGFIVGLYYYRKNFIKYSIFILIFYIGFVIIAGNDPLSFEERMKTYGVFYLPAYVMLVFLFNILVAGLNYKTKKLIVLLSLIGVSYNFFTNIAKELTYKKMVFPHDYGRMSLAMLPRNVSTLIVLGGEKDFPIIYQQKICKFREDINIIQLNFLGKIWNLKDSLKHGVAYKPFDDNESDNKKIIKSVVLYQKEILGKRVFTNIFNNDELPKIIWNVNGVFQEANKIEKLDWEYFLRYRGMGGDDKFIENILKLNNSFKGE